MAGDRERFRRWRDPTCDLYAALGVARSASPRAVKQAFRRAALGCHPDKVPEQERESATQRFKLIAEAYEVLADGALRRRYDSVRAAGCQRQSAARPSQPRSANARTCSSSEAAPHEEKEECAGCADLRPPWCLRACRKCPQRVCERCELCWDCLPGFGEEAAPGTEAAAPGAPGPGLEPLLLAMGFTGEGVRAAAAAGCASAAAAVELLMGSPGSGAGAGAASGASPAQRLGALEWLLQPFLPWGTAAEAAPAGESASTVVRGAELAAALVELGFEAARAEAASRRCSSLEAAVEWLLAHPEVEA